MKRSVSVDDRDVAREVLGPRDLYLRRIRDAFDVTAVLRAGKIVIEGATQQVTHAQAAIKEIVRIVGAIGRISRDEVERILEGAGGFSGGEKPEEVTGNEGLIVGRGREILARTTGQDLYIRTMRENDIVFCIGPAGTGKTYLAVASALAELEAGRVRRIVLTRPAVEAGERLGFLPGDLRDKVNPYLRPLYDSLQDMMSYNTLTRLMEQGVVEVAPLAYMRGRTLSHAFVILDEAQNTTSSQMLMFLTRLGIDSKSVVTGDVTQTDLPDPTRSGLLKASQVLGSIDGIGMVHLSEQDIVRHHLVRRIIAAYDQDRSSRLDAGDGERGSNG